MEENMMDEFEKWFKSQEEIGEKPMTPEQNHELEEIIEEQIMLMNTEKLAGNVVKEQFHKGVLFGIKLILTSLKLERDK